MVYGDTSSSHRERFEAGAFGNLDDGNTRTLNLRHNQLQAIAWTGGGGLEVRDTDRALEVVATVPRTPAGDMALRDASSGKLRGLSVEFNAIRERRDAGIRVLSQAYLSGFGLVEFPSYQSSTVEVRQGSVTVQSSIPADVDLACECSGPQCRWARFTGDAMREMFQRVFEQFERETIATYGNYSRPLASVGKGTLRGRMVKDDLEVEIDLPNSEAGRAVQEAHEAAGVVVRPFLDAERSSMEKVGDVMHYSDPVVRAFIVSATDAREGWPIPNIIPTPGERSELVIPRRPRLWL